MIEGEKVYKIFVVEDGVVKNLFRAIDGSREVDYDVWLKAEKKWSKDGGNQDEYLTGIHVLRDREKAFNYLNNFRTEKNRVVIQCYAEGLREKPTNSDVYLADWLYVPSESIEEVLV